MRRPQQPVEKVILAAGGSFPRGSALEKLDESVDSPAFFRLDLAKNSSPSPTKHFFNGLLVVRSGLFAHLARKLAADEARGCVLPLESLYYAQRR